eukprot:TRINITY_DN24491_c0_g1_i1.p1 TRINITY_DN24491_c0_g1~~TRINITY_DN24491_c0_g1_i1.p1  ORF type:complete len:191 (-),score=39.18 TRINITY_DN24491_c0_g1_i1:114-614(-)
MSDTSAALQGTSARGNGELFLDAQSHLQNLLSEISRVRQSIKVGEMASEDQVEELRDKLRREASEAREIANALRYDLDDTVHTRTSILKDALEEMLHLQRTKDRRQQDQLDSIETDLHQTKAGLATLAAPWQNLQLRCFERRPDCRKYYAKGLESLRTGHKKNNSP